VLPPEPSSLAGSFLDDDVTHRGPCRGGKKRSREREEEEGGKNCRKGKREGLSLNSLTRRIKALPTSIQTRKRACCVGKLKKRIVEVWREYDFRPGKDALSLLGEARRRLL